MDCLAYSSSLHFIIAGKSRQEPEAAGHIHRQEQRQMCSHKPTAHLSPRPRIQTRLGMVPFPLVEAFPHKVIQSRQPTPGMLTGQPDLENPSLLSSFQVIMKSWH